MFKRICIMLLAIVLAASLFGCSFISTSSPSTMTDAVPVSEPIAAETEPTVAGFADISEVTCEPAVDYDGEPCVLVKIVWTNSDNDSKQFDLEYTVDLYQNGIEVDSVYFLEGWSDDNILNNGMVKARPGVTLEIYKAYKVDLSAPFEVEIDELFSFEGHPVIYEFDLSN